MAMKISPRMPTASGRQPWPTRSFRLVRRPTPANAGRNAHCDRLERLLSWPLVKKPAVARTEMARKPRMNLGNFCQRKSGLFATCAACPLRRPVDRVAEDDEADEGGARGLGEDGPAAGVLPVERAGDDGLGGVVDGEAGPHAVSLLAHVQGVADGGEGEQRDGAEREDGGDRGGGVFLFGVDGALRGHDGGDSADGGADGEQAGELGRQPEDAAEQRHHREREDRARPRPAASESPPMCRTSCSRKRAPTRTMPSLSQSS